MQSIEAIIFFLAHMARARLRDRHQENLKRKLELLKAEQGVEETEPTESKSVIEVKEEPNEEVPESRYMRVFILLCALKIQKTWPLRKTLGKSFT